ncbi:hypothetical protein [Marinobacter sp. ELB17]|uniref:hypothetical protein n=1 Tax=Marinobacter sp. ELB17 TaxID=270374 RepID=UPI0012F4E7C0|nr:hypothetical protein [Marinobacter sp. ELB17]
MENHIEQRTSGEIKTEIKRLEQEIKSLERNVSRSTVRFFWTLNFIVLIWIFQLGSGLWQGALLSLVGLFLMAMATDYHTDKQWFSFAFFRTARHALIDGWAARLNSLKSGC